MLAGKSRNGSGRAPVWAAPGTAGINPFKQSAEAQEEAQKEAERQAMEQASKENAPVRQSYADQAKSHKSAFFSRAAASKEPQQEEVTPGAYGSIVRPKAAVEEQHVRDTRYKQAKGQVLEGQRPAIMDPSTQVAPTAVKPVLGFKPLNPQ
jgi:serine phosphatase RsbU (regulator of sigma subunit)